jgi:hypothetical protein
LQPDGLAMNAVQLNPAFEQWFGHLELDEKAAKSKPHFEHARVSRKRLEKIEGHQDKSAGKILLTRVDAGSFPVC